MKLVVVESPSKAKTINKYLGKEYKVVSSKGHFIDLPKSKLGVIVENGFEPMYEVTKPQVLKELKKEYKGKTELILAADLDREGEAIAYHVAKELGAIDKTGDPKKGKIVKRIVFNEISKNSILESLKNPRDLDMNLFHSQQARRILDRLVGYKISPVIWKKITFGLSAGRVQSVALRLVGEREMDRENFKTEESWEIFAFVPVASLPSITISLHVDSAKENYEEKFVDKFKFVMNDKNYNLKKQEETISLVKSLENYPLNIKEVRQKEIEKNPGLPFITSTLQRASANIFGYSSKKTMDIAQKLYEKGLITYMRTDSYSISADFQEKLKKYIFSKYGENYINGKKRDFSKFNKKNAQEAHECIRPVEMTFVNGLLPEESNIYKLIFNRTVEAMMANAVILTQTVIAKINGVNFKNNSNIIKFDGFMILREKNESTSKSLSNLKSGDSFKNCNFLAKQSFSSPPPRYTESTLIKKLEELGIGRPSTFASIIQTILARKYVIKENKYFVPTDVGLVVNKFMNKYFVEEVDYEFTASLERNLDLIAGGKLEWVKFLDDFYTPFSKKIELTEKNIPRGEFTVLGQAEVNIKCPECSSSMQIKLGRFGKFYSCSKYPECKGMLDISGISKEEIEKEASSFEFLENYEKPPINENGKSFVLKKGRFGKYWANPDKAKDFKPLVMKREYLEKVYGYIPKTELGVDFVLKKGRFGEFWAHPDYPKVKEIRKIPKK